MWGVVSFAHMTRRQGIRPRAVSLTLETTSSNRVLNMESGLHAINCTILIDAPARKSTNFEDLSPSPIRSIHQKTLNRYQTSPKPMALATRTHNPYIDERRVCCSTPPPRYQQHRAIIQEFERNGQKRGGCQMAHRAIRQPRAAAEWHTVAFGNRLPYTT